MKMLKKAAAVLLAAAMSLVMLTACGGGSGSGTAATLPRDKAKEEQIVSWAQEYAAAAGLNLEANAGVSDAAAAGLPDAKKYMDIQQFGGTGDANAIYKSMVSTIGNSLYNQKKAGVPAAMACVEEAYTKENVVKVFGTMANQIMASFDAAKITAKTVGAAVTVQDGKVYIVMVVAT